MKKKIFLSLGTSLIFSVVTGCAMTPEQTSQTLAGFGQILQQSQQSTATAPATGTTPAVVNPAATQTATLVDVLMQQLGVTQPQAQTGAGVLFQYAKTQMQPSAFSQLEQAVPGIGALLGAVPAQQVPTSGNKVVALATAFQQQGLSANMVQQFIPVVLQYVTNTGGNSLASPLSFALTGR